MPPKPPTGGGMPPPDPLHKGVAGEAFKWLITEVVWAFRTLWFQFAIPDPSSSLA
ncbi:hypothetical protein [Lusitaniella coriacea]|uniref:hypothetical protein n=1 Tax=Lusitaniella coriacea TaxID=1983105 RepID=UPI003CF76761